MFKQVCGEKEKVGLTFVFFENRNRGQDLPPCFGEKSGPGLSTGSHMLPSLAPQVGRLVHRLRISQLFKPRSGVDVDLSDQSLPRIVDLPFAVAYEFQRRTFSFVLPHSNVRQSHAVAIPSTFLLSPCALRYSISLLSWGASPWFF